MIPRSLLDGAPLLTSLNEAALATLAARGTLRAYPSGRALFRAGTDAKGLFLVLEGRVRVVRDTVGRSQVVHLEGAGGTLGEVPLFTAAGYPATATAMEPTRCLLFDAATVRVAMAADPELAVRLLARLARRVRDLIGRLDQLSFTTVRARLARYLAERADQSVGAVVSLGITQRQLADELGTVREVVVKELAILARAGAVRSRGGGRLEIIDRALLEWLASAHDHPEPPAPGPRGEPRGGPRS